MRNGKKEDREGEKGEEEGRHEGEGREWDGEVGGEKRKGGGGRKRNGKVGPGKEVGREIVSVSLASFLCRRPLLLTQTIRQSIFWLK